MYHLIIVAYPESAAVIMVGQETEDVDAAEVYRGYVFMPDLVSGISDALTNFEKEDIKDCCCYGPSGYIEKIAEIVENAFPELNITIEKAGA